MITRKVPLEDEAPTSRSIVLGNMHEYTRHGMDPGFPESQLSRWRDAGAVYGDVALFWGDDHRAVVTPREVAPEFIRYVQDRLSLSHLVAWSPKQYTSDFCKDILADDDLMAHLVDFFKNNNNNRLHAWGATQDVFLLLSALSGRGVQLQTPDLPGRDAFWTTNYLDSKAGFRYMAAQLSNEGSGVQMPEGYICDSLRDALELVNYFHGRNAGCVIKANLGVGGLGTVLLPASWQQRSPRALHAYLKSKIATLPYFRQGPVIIEQEVQILSIPAGQGLTMGAIFINVYIDPSGQVEILGGGAELRDHHNHYVGAEMGRDSIFVRFSGLLETIIRPICAALSQMGYRGFGAFDFLSDGAGNPLLLEFNPRRCGESHVYDLGNRLLGPDWQTTHYALTRLPLGIQPHGEVAVGKILDTFDQVNCQLASDQVFVFPTCLSWLLFADPGIGYVAFGPDRKSVHAGDLLLRSTLAATIAG